MQLQRPEDIPTQQSSWQLDRSAFSQLQNKPPAPPLNHVGIDVDGILFRFIAAFSSHLGQPFTDQDCPHWKSYPYPVSAQQSQAAQDYAHTYSAIKEFGLYPGAVEGVNALLEHNLTVSIITRRQRSRAEETAQALRELGLQWNGQFVAAPDLDKVSWCQQNEVATLIDDRPATIAAAQQSGLSVFTLAHPYTSEFTEIRATDWRKLADRVLASVLYRASAAPGQD